MFGIWIFKIVTLLMYRTQKKSANEVIKGYNTPTTLPYVLPKNHSLILCFCWSSSFKQNEKEKRHLVKERNYFRSLCAISTCLFFRFTELFFLLFFNK